MRIVATILVLLWSVCLALAQAPPPVPGLPDAPRLTSTTLNNSTGPVNVGFQIYGDGTDYGNWVEVWVKDGTGNYTFKQPVTDYTLTSPSGALGSIARPITNAQITFAAPQTGTVYIVGARRPRRVAQFAENKGVPARDLNVALTDLVTQNRETWDKLNDLSGRAILGLPGETLSTLPPAAQRKNMVLGFDASGNLQLYLPSDSGVFPGSVFSVFGRAGAVVAATGDYSFPQISGNVALGQMAPISANNLYGNLGAGAAAISVPPCTGATGALQWTAGVGFGCATISAALPNVTADSVLGNPTAAPATPTSMPLANCVGGSNALNYNTATHLFSCNTITGMSAASVTVGVTTVGNGVANNLLSAGTTGGLLSVVAVPTCTGTASALQWSGTAFSCGTISSAPVSSVFGRTGAVVAATNDYSFSQISGTLATGQLPAGVTQTIANGTAVLGTAAIASATCASVVTVAATGVAATDVVSTSFNGDPTAVTGYIPATTGMLTIFPYPSAGNVNFKVCNSTGGSITPGAITLNWRVTR